MANNTTTQPVNVNYVRKDMTSEEHLRGLVAVLRACQRHQIPVRIRLDSASGPLASGRVKAVHRHNGMEFATTDVPVSERFGPAEAIWMLDIRNVYSVEALGLKSRSSRNNAHATASAKTETPRARAKASV